LGHFASTQQIAPAWPSQNLMKFTGSVHQICIQRDTKFQYDIFCSFWDTDIYTIPILGLILCNSRPMYNFLVTFDAYNFCNIEDRSLMFSRHVHYCLSIVVTHPHQHQRLHLHVQTSIEQLIWCHFILLSPQGIRFLRCLAATACFSGQQEVFIVHCLEWYGTAESFDIETFQRADTFNGNELAETCEPKMVIEWFCMCVCVCLNYNSYHIFVGFWKVV